MKKALSSFREKMINLSVLEWVKDDEGFGLRFEKDWSLTVWSTVKFRRNGKNLGELEKGLLDHARLSEFVQGQGIETLRFSNGVEFEVWLDKRESGSAESMMLTGPDKLIVVWNE
jgi:hypothetical protein